MPSALPPPGCAFNRGVSGALGGATAFLRVTRTGDALAGAYFHDDVTDDIPLAGRVEHETRFVLEASHSGAVTSTFRGTCDGDGALRGDWTSADGKTRHAFILSIPSHVTIGTRRQRLNVRTTDFVPPDESPFCELDRRFPVVLGLATGEIERETQPTVLTNTPESIRDEETVKRTRACKEERWWGARVQLPRVIAHDLQIDSVPAATEREVRKEYLPTRGHRRRLAVERPGGAKPPELAREPALHVGLPRPGALFFFSFRFHIRDGPGLPSRT